MEPTRQGRPDVTLPAIAHVLGIDANTVLYWTITGRLHVGRCGKKTVISVDAAFTCANPDPDKFLIVTKPANSASRQAISSAQPTSRAPASGRKP